MPDLSQGLGGGEPAAAEDEAALVRRLTGIANQILRRYTSKQIPPGLDRADLRQTAIIKMLLRHRQAQRKGKRSHRDILYKTGKDAVVKALMRAWRSFKTEGRCVATDPSVVECALDPSPSPSEPAELLTLHESLKLLKPAERQIIELRYGLRDGISHTVDEMAEVLGIPRSTAFDRAQAALAHLTQLMNRGQLAAQEKDDGDEESGQRDPDNDLRDCDYECDCVAGDPGNASACPGSQPNPCCRAAG